MKKLILLVLLVMFLCVGCSMTKQHPVEMSYHKGLKHHKHKSQIKFYEFGKKYKYNRSTKHCNKQ